MINPVNKFAPASQAIHTKAASQPSVPTAEPSASSFGSDQLKSDIPEGLRNISATALSEARKQVQGRDYLPGELFVKLKPSDSGVGHSQFADKFGVQVLESLELPPNISAKFGGELVRVKLPEGLEVPEAMAAMKGDSRVLYSDVNDLIPPQAPPAKADPDIENAWGNFSSPTQGGSVIAIIDSGMDIRHPDLQGSLWTNPGEISGNGIDDDANGYVDDVHGFNVVGNNGDLTDLSGQGTHAAGIIAGLNLGKSPESSSNLPVMQVKIFDQSGETDTAQVVKGMLYALKMGARVTSNEQLSDSPNRVLLDLKSLT